MPPYTPIRSLVKGLRILEALASSHFMLSFQELTSKTRIPKATVFRFLQTLLSQNYVSFDPKSRKYFVGPRAMSLGSAALAGLDLKEVALPYLNQLSSASDQNLNLAILDRTEILYIECVQKWDLLKMNVSPGSRLNAYQTSSGRCILAFLKPEKFEAVRDRLLKNREALKWVGPKAGNLARILEEVRKHGYAVNDEELTKGIRAVAAPIFNGEGEVEAAINMPVFSHRVSRRELIRRFLPMLRETADNISAARGFERPESRPVHRRAARPKLSSNRSR
jgi:IclR family transcriptional regulator, pca regulon regulatory protein